MGGYLLYYEFVGSMLVSVYVLLPGIDILWTVVRIQASINNDSDVQQNTADRAANAINIALWTFVQSHAAGAKLGRCCASR